MDISFDPLNGQNEVRSFTVKKFTPDNTYWKYCHVCGQREAEIKNNPALRKYYVEKFYEGGYVALITFCSRECANIYLLGNF